MLSRRPLIPAVLAASVALAPAAAAQAPPPTLAFPSACSSDAAPLAFTGAGYTPSGAVRLQFSVPEEPRAALAGFADAAGAIAGSIDVLPDLLLTPDEIRRDITATATDVTREAAGEQPPESHTGGAGFTFSRWMGFSPGRYVIGRKVAVEAYGWAWAAGKPVHLLFRRHGRTAASVRVGPLAAPCGDVSGKVRVPRSLAPGEYRIVLSTSRRAAIAPYTWRKGRVVRAGRSPRRAISSATDGAPTRMKRVR